MPALDERQSSFNRIGAGKNCHIVAIEPLDDGKRRRWIPGIEDFDDRKTYGIGSLGFKKPTQRLGLLDWAGNQYAYTRQWSFHFYRRTYGTARYARSGRRAENALQYPIGAPAQ